MKLGVEVNLGPGHVVLDGAQLPLPNKAQLPIFGPYLLRPNGWMGQDATWFRGGPITTVMLIIIIITIKSKTKYT